jgi:hypothetical protein
MGCTVCDERRRSARITLTSSLAAGNVRNAPKFPHRLFKTNADNTLAAGLLSYGHHAAALFFIALRIQQYKFLARLYFRCQVKFSAVHTHQTYIGRFPKRLIVYSVPIDQHG